MGVSVPLFVRMVFAIMAVGFSTIFLAYDVFIAIEKPSAQPSSHSLFFCPPSA